MKLKEFKTLILDMRMSGNHCKRLLKIIILDPDLEPFF